MSGEAILILEPDRDLELQLNEMLTASGYQVYAAETPDSLVKALETTAFPLIIIALEALEASGSDVASFTASALGHQPECMVLFAADEPALPTALSMLDAGGAGFVDKPYAPEGVLRRLSTALDRRRRARSRTKVWERRAKAAEHMLSEAREGSGDDRARLLRVVDFAEYALQKFLALERRNLELERTIKQLENPDDNDADREPLPTWIAHPDDAFTGGVVGLGPQLNLDFRPPMATGGEILDKLSASAPELIILGDNLPDIPGQMVAETIRTEYPNVQLIVVEGWGTPNRSVSLTGAGAKDSLRTMENVDDLIAMIELAKERCYDTAIGREFAAKFKKRHDDFLRRFAEIKKSSSS